MYESRGMLSFVSLLAFDKMLFFFQSKSIDIFSVVGTH